jgi:Leucine-rich repeat (LRR) protein
MTTAPISNPRPKLRWHRLTPDLTILGLLITEVFLLLSERFQWFLFNERKGLTLVIAVGVLAVTLLVLLLWFCTALLLRRKFQYSIHSLFVLTVVVAILGSSFAVKVQQARRQQEAVEELVKLGCDVKYDYPRPDIELRNTLIDSDVVEVTTARDGKGDINDDKMIYLKGMTKLKSLYLFETQITNAGLENIQGLTQLRLLDLRNCKITDSGLKYIKGLTQLQQLTLKRCNLTGGGLENIRGLTQLVGLNLVGNKINDAGMVHLKGLKNLITLYFADAHITDIGLSQIKGMTQLQYLGLGNTEITNDGLAHLEGMKQLKYLDLSRTKITDAGLIHLAKLTQLQEIDLTNTNITDEGLEHLQGLKQLKTLILTNTKVTDAGKRELKKALPNL